MAFSETEFETPIQAGAVLNANHLILFSLTCYTGSQVQRQAATGDIYRSNTKNNNSHL